MENIEKIIINKNRGWRGLAELQCIDNENIVVFKTVFSFSPDTWHDLMRGYIVTSDKDKFYIIQFDNIDALPQGHQRSVLIKNFTASVIYVTAYDKTNWPDKAIARSNHYLSITDYIKNKNNHTTSDWNYIGIRVVPTI